MELYLSSSYHYLSISISKHLLLYSLVFFGFRMKGYFVHGSVASVLSQSSPSIINGTKGSSTWLHWNYTYVGDTEYVVLGNRVRFSYKEQIIGFNSTSNSRIQPIAKRIGAHGALTLASPVPGPFNGRVEVIASNSTLVIHNLQYNDSAYQFSSTVEVELTANSTGSTVTVHNLLPVITISVTGTPVFINQPPSALDVAEHSQIRFAFLMDGNPIPSADFKWSHLSSPSATNIRSVQLYPYIYSLTHTSRSIDVSYCGMILQTTIKNSIGSSAVSTNVTVSLPNLNRPFFLRTRKHYERRCVQVNWERMFSGACYVRYSVAFLNAGGSHIAIRTVYNSGEMELCDSSTFNSIDRVQLTVTFRSLSKTVIANVTEDLTGPGSVTTISPNAGSIQPSKSPDSLNPRAGSIGLHSSLGLVIGAVLVGLSFLGHIFLLR